MRVLLGPFHPYLEKAFGDEIFKEKTENLARPLLVLVPSDSLRRRLKALLAGERRLSLVHVHLLTFYQLSLRLVAEARGGPLPALCDDLFLEEVLRRIIRRGSPGAEPFGGIDERLGGCAVLWQTLRDLKDGMVEPSLALEALGEGHFGRDLSGRIANLLALFRTLLSFCKERGLQDDSDLHRSATAQVPSSGFLEQFARIFYYGFYDLTQVQVDLFHAVAECRATTLFFPLYHPTPSHPGWIFAERFYRRYVQGKIGPDKVDNLFPVGSPPADGASAYRLFDEKSPTDVPVLTAGRRAEIASAFGVHDEIAAVAKEILRLTSDEKMGFDEIGVVARSLDGYVAPITQIFAAHRIPVTGTIEEPLTQFPLAKAVVLLLDLPAKDYLRSHVIDLLSSPYFNFTAGADDGNRARPDLWDLATRQLGICKGIEEWRRLRRYANRDLTVSGVSSEDHPRMVRIAAAQIRALLKLFDDLYGDLSNLPESAPWSRYAALWSDLLEKYLAISRGEDSAEAETPEHRAGAEILGILERLAGLDAVDPDVPLQNFTQTFQHWLERSVVSSGNRNGKGVAVLNAMAARGLSFRALFIVGLNEGVFPRTIREDAFLRDREREIFERDLGYKISEKLGGFDEEKLIFALLVGAARERLYCLFQRADEGGRVLAPSWYLDELRRAFGDGTGRYLRETTIPRGIADKRDAAPFDREDLLLPEELAIRLSLEDKEPAGLVASFAPAPAIYDQGRRAVERLDLGAGRLGEFDGMVGPLPEFWDRFSKRGLSPTPLETYGRCPFQFFARHVLGLERLERPEEISGPSAADFGELGHLILKSFYQELIEHDYFGGRTSDFDFGTILASVAQKVFAEYAETNPIGYPLAWEILQENIIELLNRVLRLDLEELFESGYRPIVLEADLTERLEGDWPEPLNGLTIYGRMDRIDAHRGENRLRVIDYKFKLGGHPTPSDKDLYRSALRGERLQPLFYFVLGRRFAAKEDLRLSDPSVESVFYYLAQRWPEGPLVAQPFGADGLGGKLGREIKGTLAYLASGIHAGRFFIQPGDYCRHCEVSEICRKNHPPSLWRAESDPVTKPHRVLREKTLKDL